MITARDLIRREAYKDNRRQVYQNPTVPAIRAMNQPMTEGQNAPISAAANSSGPGKSPLPSLSNPTFASQVSNPVPSAAAPPPSMGAAGKVGRATNDPDIAASGTLDPAEKHLRDLIAQRDAIPADKDVKDDPSRLHSFYKTAQMANRYAMRSGGDPGTVLGATLGGGLRGLFDRKSAIIEGNHEKNDEITKAIAAAEIPVDKAHARQYQDAVVQERKEAHEQAARDREQKQRDLVMTKRESFVNRLDVLKQGEDFKSGKATTFVDKNGKVWKKFLQADSTGHAKDDEPLINPITHEQEFDPGEEMVEGVDPKTGKPVQLKAKQMYAADSSFQSQQDRLEETTRHNKVTEVLSQDKFNQAKDQFQKQFKLRQDMFDDVKKARDSKDAEAEKKAQARLDAQDQLLEQMGVHADDALKNGELTQQQMDDLRIYLAPRKPKAPTP